MSESSKSFATEPITSLLDRPLQDMTQEELRDFTARLRQLRQSPQTLKSLLNDELEDVDLPGRRGKRKQAKVDILSLLDMAETLLEKDDKAS